MHGKEEAKAVVRYHDLSIFSKHLLQALYAYIIFYKILNTYASKAVEACVPTRCSTPSRHQSELFGPAFPY